VYFPVIVSWSLLVFSSSESSTASSFAALLRSFRSSVMLMHIFVGSVDVYSSNMVFGHSKSIIATRDGSMARSLIPSGSILNVASSTRIEIDVIMSFRSLASAILSLNMEGYLLYWILSVGNKRL
jgi:hypothetical protein